MATAAAFVTRHKHFRDCLLLIYYSTCFNCLTVALVRMVLTYLQELIPEFYAGDGSFLTNRDDLPLGVTQVSCVTSIGSLIASKHVLGQNAGNMLIWEF